MSVVFLKIHDMAFKHAAENNVALMEGINRFAALINAVLISQIEIDLVIVMMMAVVAGVISMCVHLYVKIIFRNQQRELGQQHRIVFLQGEHLRSAWNLPELYIRTPVQSKINGLFRRIKGKMHDECKKDRKRIR